ncbi:uncharacterized protein N7483_005033 [Penicillium malachiteum]|uniref:uncharacterized protein n=1 Tax=Penicillium malachiteum TaxID=1324776 RepID=UPI00254663BF|nr:uncharacterized protein N7483_005033 [Penicillium malachiteum]KAJ5730525.1 hypothetical protein N7483_005033 [Penicillium malachiteum]
MVVVVPKCKQYKQEARAIRRIIVLIKGILVLPSQFHTSVFATASDVTLQPETFRREPTAQRSSDRKSRFHFTIASQELLSPKVAEVSGRNQ